MLCSIFNGFETYEQLYNFQSINVSLKKCLFHLNRTLLLKDRRGYWFLMSKEDLNEKRQLVKERKASQRDQR